MQSKGDFDPTRIKKVSILQVEPNDYNPKQKDTKEYEFVKRSLEINGLKQPIFVRTEKDNDQYIIVDGEQRYTAATELGYEEIYVYDLGEISEEEAKSLTIWLETQVPFDEVELAPLVVELHKLDMELPFTDVKIQDFENMASFSFDDMGETSPLKEDDEEEGFKSLLIKMTADQFKVVREAIDLVANDEDVSEGRALELLVADGLAGYQQTTKLENGPETYDENDEAYR